MHDLKHLIEHAAHLLPSQGPITVFVHHNTLHAFEHLPFDDALARGAAIYGCQPYLSEELYRRELARGRIRPDDLSAVLMDDLGEDADALIGFMGTRYHLRLAMLEHSLRLGSDAELRWLISETDALYRFRPEAPKDQRARVIEQVKHWILRDYLAGGDRPGKYGVAPLLEQFGASAIERWPERRWEAFTLHLLWRICLQGVHGVPHSRAPSPPLVRHRDLLLALTGRDTDLMVNEVLIRFCAAFLDQGFAEWTMPGRDEGFFDCFVDLNRDSLPVEKWLQGLGDELRRVRRDGLTPLQSIEESLSLLGVGEDERGEYLTRTLLALRGWAGMLHQMETNAEWAARPAPRGTLMGYVAIRLILDLLAQRYVARQEYGVSVEPRDLRAMLRPRIPHEPRVSVEQRAYLVFQLAQVRGWNLTDLQSLSKAGWSRLVQEIESFGSLERRRTYHRAYERRYRNQVLDAFANRSKVAARTSAAAAEAPTFQVVCCIDEREESFRRHLEEIDPRCETFGVAGFFGAAMYYRGVAEAHFRPLCPVNVKPRHYVQEEPIPSFQDASRVQAAARRRVGSALRWIHMGSRSFVGGVLTGLVGSLATAPLLMRVLWPRSAARIRRALEWIVTPARTQLSLHRSAPEPGRADDQRGYSHEEMAGVVSGTLRAIGLTRRFSRLVIIAGHGSSSLNNPQEAAYDCGACGGASGGPNARVFAQMANDPRVRLLLAQRGLVIPGDTHFVGACHNTCDDGVTYFDLDRLPNSHRSVFDDAWVALDEARKRNAHERCRRFESASLSLDLAGALQHVEGRSEDLSQARPECGHATNAVCFVGRRSRTQGLFLDRRVFLASYDPTQDDDESTVLAGVLGAVVPVCGGINLEYYFSTVDSAGYGCGSKLPHNITSLLGVMDGAASDLRPGLPWQMVEIHEPMRIVFVVETTPKAMFAVIDGNEEIRRLVHNNWVQFATLDPNGSSIHVFDAGRFEPYTPESDELAVTTSSMAWYRGWRDHLGCALIAVGEPGEAPIGGEMRS